jgi:RNA polymerase sigma-70 factor (ECF subfamily)
MSSRPPPLDPSRPDPLDVREIVAHQGFLRALARGLVGAGADADDLVQRTYLRVLERAPARPLHLRAWLRRVVFRLARDERRADERRLARDVAGSGAAGSETAPADALVQRMELHQRLVALVLALEPHYRSIVLLHHFDGLTVAKAAERIGVPIETARTRLRRALQTLRVQLDAELGGGAATLAALLPFLGVPLVSTTTKATLVAASLLLFGGVVLWRLNAGDPAAGRADLTGGAALPVAAADAAGCAAPSTEAASAERTAVETAPAAAHGVDALAAGCGALRLKTVWQDDGRVAPRTHVRVAAAPAEGGAPLPFPSARRTATDERGELLLRDLAPGRVVVVAAGFDVGDAAASSPPTNCSREVVVRAGEVVEATLEIPLGVVVEGAVVDGAERPVAGAEIWLGDSKYSFCDGSIVATSDEHGRFRLDSVANMHYLAARAPGFSTSDALAATFTFDRSRLRKVRLVLGQRGGALRGRVVDGAGRPVAGALLVAVGEERGSWLNDDGSIGAGPPPCSARSGADGRFELAALPLGEGCVGVLAEGFAPLSRTVHVEGGEPAERELVVTEGGSIAGVVSDADGAPLAGLTVDAMLSLGPGLFMLGQPSARTDDHGAFAFAHVTPGLVSLRVDAGKRGSTQRPCTVEEEKEQRCDLALARPLAFRGRVVDAGGRGVARARVVAEPAEPLHGAFPPPQETDEEGRFAIEGVEAIAWTLAVFDPDVRHFAALEHGPVKPGGELTLVLDAKHRPSARIVGRVVGPEGVPVKGAKVGLFRVGGNVIVHEPLLEEEGGRFELGPLPPGAYALDFGADGFCALGVGERELHAEERLDLGELRLQRPAALVVRASRADGVAVEPRDVRLRAAKGTRSIALASADRELRASGLDPGDYVVEVVGEGLAQTARVVTVTEGATATVDVPVETGVAMRLVLRAADGALKGPVRWTASDANGDELEGTLEVAAGAATAELPLCLAVGDWTLEATAADSARGEASLRASRRTGRGDAVEVVMRRP